MNGRFKITYKIRWHLLVVHFPISLYGVAFLFQVLHLIFSPEAFTLATTVVILSASIAMIPTTTSGWLDWKQRYKGANTFLFKRKIITAFAMLGISIPITIWRFLTYSLFYDEPYHSSHWIFFFATFLLIIGAIIEGYYGGKLTHGD